MHTKSQFYAKLISLKSIVAFFSFILIFLILKTHYLVAEEIKPKRQKVVVTLGYHIDPCQGPILYALNQGIFEKYGLDVVLMPASGGEESSRQVAMKHAHIGITKSANHLVRVSSKLPLKKIGTLVGHPLEVLITHEEMRDLKELKGKKIGFSTSNPTFSLLVLDKILEKQGLIRDDVTLIAFQHGMMQAFLSHQVDAIFAATHPYDTKMAEQFNTPIRFYTYEEFGIPPYEQFMFFAHKNDEHANFIRPFLKAIKEAIQLIKRSPGTAWQELCHAYPELDTSLNYRIWMHLIELFEDNPEDLFDERMKALMEFLKKNKVDDIPLVRKNITLDDVMMSSQTLSS